MRRENDDIDRRLLALLQNNARETTTQLGRKLGIARTTVQERISRLERNGTIAGYAAILQRDPFRRHAEAIVHLAVEPRRQPFVVGKLRSIPEIKICQTVTGEFELLCLVRVPELEDVQPVLAELGAIPGVERVRSMVVLSTNFDLSQGDFTAVASSQARALSTGEAG